MAHHVDMDYVQRMIQKEEEEIKQKEEQHVGVKVGYPPAPGKHHIRIFTDPNDDLFRAYTTHWITTEEGKQRSVLCLDFANSVEAKRREQGATDTLSFGPCPLCVQSKRSLAINKANWKDGSATAHFIYVYLVKTSNPGKHWEAGNFYAMSITGKGKAAILKMLSTIAAVPGTRDYITAALNPTVEGAVFEFNYQKGREGQPSIQAAQPAMTSPAVDQATLDAAWKPLDEIYPTIKTIKVEEYPTWAKIFKEQIDIKEAQANTGGASTGQPAEKTAEEMEAELKKLQAKDDSPQVASQSTEPQPAAVEPVATGPSADVLAAIAAATSAAAAPEAAQEDSHAVKEGVTAGVTAAIEAAKTVAEIPTQVEKVTSEATDVAQSSVTPITEAKSKKKAVNFDRNTSIFTTLLGDEIKIPDRHADHIEQVVIKDGCWGENKSSQPKCVTCPVNAECLTEKKSLAS